MARRPVFPPSELSSLSRKGSKGLAPGRASWNKGKAFHATYEHVFLARQDVSAQQVEELTAQFKGVIEQMGGKVAKTRILGREVALLPHPQEPQGALHAVQSRCAAGRAQRDRAPGAAQRRRAALSHRPRRRARGRPLGDDAQGRPRPRARRARRRLPRPRPRRLRGDRDRGDRGGRGDRDRDGDGRRARRRCRRGDEE